MKWVLVTGGSGFIGRYFCHRARQFGWKLIVLTRDSQAASRHLPQDVRLIESLKQLDSTLQIDAVVNLAGQPLAEGRWNRRRKEKFFSSRVDMTDALYDFFAARKQVPAVLISGSAIGYYGGGRGADKPVTEEGGISYSFSHQLCRRWEQSAQQFEQLACRVCYLRTGIVLGRVGALAKMLPAFRLGLGGPIGDGGQWMPWIHIDDMVNVIIYCINHSQIKGPVNATAPNPVRNRDFSKILGTVLKRPAVLTMPEKIIKLLFGEMGEALLLQGQRIVPKKLQDMGFEFEYTDLRRALDHLIGKNMSAQR